jgi:hypothetical protein
MPRLHAGAPAAVFPRLQPHRAGLLQDAGALEEDEEQDARGALFEATHHALRPRSRQRTPRASSSIADPRVRRRNQYE